MGSGKTSLAQYLESAFGFVRAPFAEALRLEAARNCWLACAGGRVPDGWRWPAEKLPEEIRKAHFEGELHLGIESLFRQKPTPPAVRRFLQEYGTWRREQDPDYWVDRWIERYASTLSKRGVVIDDLRFSNEAVMVHRLGGIVVQLVRDVDTCLRASGADPELAKHASEAPLPPEMVTVWLDSNRPLDKLYPVVRFLLINYTKFMEAHLERLSELEDVLSLSLISGEEPAEQERQPDSRVVAPA